MNLTGLFYVMTFTEFKSMVAGYANRTAASFVLADGTDILALAINEAKKEGQLEHDFLATRMDGYLITGVLGAELNTTTTTYGGATAINVKKVRSVWSCSATGGRIKNLDLEYESVESRLRPTEEEQDISKIRAFQRGTKLHVTGYETNTTFLVDVYKWMPDYSVSVTTDFFLDNYVTWLKLRSLYQLNFYLKEDQRVNITQAALREAWDKVMAYENNVLVNYNLD